MATVAVLGGGISGLTCAYYLKTLGRSKIKYLFLLEKKPKFGGWIETTKFSDNAVFEHGPRTIRVGTKAGFNALTLAEELGLSNRILKIDVHNKIAKKNFILSKNELFPLPRDVLSLLRTKPPFTKPLAYYIIKECIRKSEKLDDESIFNFIERRFGSEIAKNVIDPLCRGITAGDAHELSVRSTFPFLPEMELKHGSVVKGLLKERENPGLEFMQYSLVKKACKELWKMWTLKNGLGELIDTLACAIEERGVSDLLFNTSCSSLTFKGTKADVVFENEKVEVDHVFSSIPAYELSMLLQNYPSLSKSLAQIPTVDVAVVYLEYKDNVLKQNGFGFLSPSSEDTKIMGIVFDSCCFPELNGSSKTRLTCMLGGKWFNDIFGNVETVSENVILQTAIEGATKHLKITDKPVRYKVVIQKKCIPQYIVGHYKVLENIDEEVKKNNLCLSLFGASYKGAGVPDCIQNAKLSVEEFLKSL